MKAIETIINRILSVLFFVIFFCFLLQIFMRYVINHPLSWTLELTIMAYLWTIFLGSSFVLKRSEHVRFGIVYDLVPVKVKMVFDVISDLIVIVFFALSLKPTYDYVVFLHRQKTPMLEIPFSFVYSVFIIFMVSYSIRCILRIISLFRGRECLSWT